MDELTAPNELENNEALLFAAGAALFSLGRIFGRQSMQQVLSTRKKLATSDQTVELSQILVAMAVAAGPNEQEPEITIGDVAERLAIDPSTASRLVAETIHDGYVARLPSAVDGRRSVLALTAAGEALVKDARRYQRSVFEDVTREWSETERLDFARLFVKFAAAVIEAQK